MKMTVSAQFEFCFCNYFAIQKLFIFIQGLNIFAYLMSLWLCLRSDCYRWIVSFIMLTKWIVDPIFPRIFSSVYVEKKITYIASTMLVERERFCL